MKTNNLLDRRFFSEPYPIDASPLIDLKSILDECMGDIELLEELISLFDVNALEFIGAAKIHLRNTDFQALGLVAHKIKAGLAMMHTDSLHSIIVLIQKECEEDQDPKHLQFLCDCFTKEYPAVKKSIDRALASLKLG